MKKLLALILLVAICFYGCNTTNKNKTPTATPFDLQSQADSIPFYKTEKELQTFDANAYLLAKNTSGSFYYMSENRTFLGIKGFIIYFFSADTTLSDVSFYASDLTVEEYLKLTEKLSKLTDQTIESIASDGSNLNDLKGQPKIDANLEIKNEQSSYPLLNSKNDIGFNTALVGANKSFFSNLTDYTLQKNSTINPSKTITSELIVNIIGQMRI